MTSRLKSGHFGYDYFIAGNHPRTRLASASKAFFQQIPDPFDIQHL